jgi:cysteine desulfurase / selenocysteine lyase
MEPWELLRQQFPLAERIAYLNHAAVSPLPLRCKDRMEAYLEELTRFGASRYPRPLLEPLSRVRELASDMLGADPSQIFVVRSTTQGIGVAAMGIPAREGDNVVLAEREFPANIRPWLPLRRRGVEVRFVPQRDGRILLDDLARAVDARTVAVSLSFVQFLSGFRLDPAPVAELCRRHDALFVLDAIQGLGVFPLDVEAAGVDFVSADAHKWLLGPEGVGVGYASERALDRIQPALEGWLSVEAPFEFFDIDQPLKRTAARFEEGAYNVAGINGLLGSLELISTVGVEAIEARVLELTDYLEAHLRRIGWTVLSPRETEAEKSGIVLASKEGIDPESLKRRLDDRGVVVSIRGGALRVSPHAYNTPEDLDELLDSLS